MANCCSIDNYDDEMYKGQPLLEDYFEKRILSSSSEPDENYSSCMINLRTRKCMRHPKGYVKTCIVNSNVFNKA